MITTADTVRFTSRYGTGVTVDGGPWADAGYETTVLEHGSVDANGVQPICVRIPYDGGTVRQYVPSTVLEVVT